MDVNSVRATNAVARGSSHTLQPFGVVVKRPTTRALGARNPGSNPGDPTPWTTPGCRLTKEMPGCLREPVSRAIRLVRAGGLHSYLYRKLYYPRGTLDGQNFHRKLYIGLFHFQVGRKIPIGLRCSHDAVSATETLLSQTSSEGFTSPF